MAKRPLTAGEIALARTIFKDSIDYDRVRISNKRHNPFHGKNITMAPNGHIYCNNTHRDDFSKCHPVLQAHFIHEMVHVWQYQNNVIHPVIGSARDMIRHKFNYQAAYKYTLCRDKDLIDYGLEQQASIVQNYFLHRQTRSHTPCPNTKQDLYNQVLKKFLENPNYARRKPWVKRVLSFKK